MSSKKIFFGQGMNFWLCFNSRVYTPENWDHEISFPRPWIWFSISYAKAASDKWSDWGLDLPPPCSCMVCTWSSLFFPSFKIDWVDFFGTDKHNSPYFCILQCHVLDRKNFCSTSYSSSNSTAKSRPTPNFLSGKNNDFQDVLPPPSFHCLKLTLEFKQVDFSVSAKLISIETPP